MSKMQRAMRNESRRTEIMAEEPYYIVIEGTNICNRDRTGMYSYIPNIFDTENIAQTHIDKSVEYRKRADLKPLSRHVPISVAEYDKKYAKLIGNKED